MAWKSARDSSNTPAAEPRASLVSGYEEMPEIELIYVL